MDVKVLRRVGGVVLAGGLVAGPMSGWAQEQATLTDAQVESNVLRALASAPELSTQNVQSASVYGTVTLTGNVHDEALRKKAENLVARTQGVKKVVDEMTLGDTVANSEAPGQSYQPAPDAGAMGQQPDSAQANAPVLQSDGTYAPAPDGSGVQPPAAQTAPPNPGYSQPNPQSNSQPNATYPQANPGYAPQYSQQTPGYPAPAAPYPGRQPMGQGYPPAPIPGGQRAGVNVTVPAGAMLRIRINRGLDSNHIQPGTNFDGTVLTDVVAGGAVAIPRGAAVQGTVIDAKKAGIFKGEGELSLVINTIMLGGNVYPLPTQIWSREGQNKTAGTVNNTLGLGVLGAVVGGLAGGGAGAAVGAGVGGAAGLAGSAAGPRGQIIIPPESVLSFTTAEPANVRTVSEAEMARLSYAAGPKQQGPPPMRRRYYSPYYGYYYGPAY